MSTRYYQINIFLLFQVVNPPQNICSLIPPTPTLYFDTLVYFSPPQNISSYQPPIKFQEETCGLLSLYLNENATSAIQKPCVGWLVPQNPYPPSTECSGTCLHAQKWSKSKNWIVLSPNPVLFQNHTPSFMISDGTSHPPAFHKGDLVEGLNTAMILPSCPAFRFVF